MSLLSKIHTPSDLKALTREQLDQVAEEIRARVIEVTSHNGGHIGPNLGVVELTMALHRVFDSPSDRFVFDVSHQGYVHKLLTGRNGEKFDQIRQTDGLSGFLCRSESPHDSFGAGHAGTALSAALGMAAARDWKKEDNHVVAVLGDAAFTCGITMEALNNIAETTSRLVIILNDNEWSIAKNVGALARYFNEIITNPVYNRIDRGLGSFLKKVPGGASVLEYGKRWKRETKDFIVGSNLFEAYGVRYIGPIDGHDLDLVTKHLEFAKNEQQPIILHLLTKKGKGYEPAMASPEKFHGLGPFDKETGKAPPKKKDTPPNYQDVFGKCLLKYARQDSRIVGITAAMPPGTGLSFLREELPGQFYDVGIAEEHAVLFAAGMATDGLRPVVAIYSTFLQRAYDPIIHDVCLQNLPVTFCMDRAGLSPNDGPTHHGLFDIAYLRTVPNTIVMQPRNEDELADMLWTCLHVDGPTFIRYPRGSATGIEKKAEPVLLPVGKAEVVREGSNIQFWALGPWVAEAEDIARELEAESGASIGVVNARFAKPLDTELLLSQAGKADLIVTFEDHVIQGGFGSAVLECINDHEIRTPVLRFGYPDRFVDHGSSTADIRSSAGLDHQSIISSIRSRASLPESKQQRTSATVDQT
ncbi:1-deoxy-D-xylulose-5-phosphate synthase [Puniceicoccales bacterium CK1056]|uniref:1-deoxy-D-xylulose-5-phosphate synthase n=1 Tax=Oceanipulchritudo coccoides TaxID=2706888 RepID=A0A6B2M037_9BACT|nr:1-deoxy-D-xylulose-5-phosphate synthase [Oceanipulchritudo coccoides]NDV62278.1 1-deoxy-D-xylulose-5-phosphate synthase [Oceanipulchritudo coccoides]